MHHNILMSCLYLETLFAKMFQCISLYYYYHFYYYLLLLESIPLLLVLGFPHSRKSWSILLGILTVQKLMFQILVDLLALDIAVVFILHPAETCNRDFFNTDQLFLLIPTRLRPILTSVVERFSPPNEKGISLLK